MINPDYPTNTGSFLIHTYEGSQMPQTFQSCYYNGMGTVCVQPDSRRNAPLPNQMMPMQPQMQQPQLMPNQMMPQMDMNAALKSLYQQPAYAMPVPASEMNIKPFSSYPPEYQAPGSQPALMDSRRFDQTGNPWAPQMPQTVQAPQSQMPNPFANTVGYMQPNMPQYVNPTMDCASMYGSYTAQPVQKKMQQFDNPYAQPQPQSIPDINWGAARQQQNGFTQSAVAYPMINMGQPQNPNELWTSIADRIWGK